MLAMLVAVLVTTLIASARCACSNQSMIAMCSAETDCTGGKVCAWGGSSCACMDVCPGNSNIKAVMLECTSGPCCDASRCQYRSTSFKCATGSAINCRQDVFCRGNEDICQSNVLADGQVCRPKAGVCDEQEVCSGGSCPSDSFSSSSTVCRTALDTTCDVEERCTGSAAGCPMDIVRDGVPCRGSNGECDNAEFCSGGRCPSDTFKNRFQNCGGTPGECETQAQCTGSSATCPGHTPKSTSTQCGPSPPPDPTCAQRQTCDGTGGGCPSGFRTKSAGSVCKAANGDCDLDDTCDGSSQTCAEKFRPTNYVCNTKNDDCGDQQTCTGSSATCPARPVRPSSYVCRPLTGSGCDIADKCDGLTYTCPDTKQSRGFVCRANVTDCDVAETCDGTSVNCPADGNRPRNYVCRASKGLCDPEEVCDGSATACGVDVLYPRGHVCRDKTGPCDVADLCPGGDSQCPPDAKEVIDTPCNPSKGICDVPELCDGSSKLCPPDEYRPLSANFVCRDPNGDCDLREICDGSGVECPADKFAVGITCRAKALANTCDVAEVCGESADCPADGFLPFNTNCDDGSELTTNDVCDNAGVCSGKCLADMACNDRNKCTEDTCSMETGRCIFTPIAGCVPDSTPAPPTNCLSDKSYRFDFLTKPGADADAVVACYFKVALTPVNGTGVVRTFAANDTERAVSFGIAPLGDDGSSAKDAKIRATTALVMRFPMSWTAAVEAVTVSSIGIDTVLAVVRDTPESQRANIEEALQAFDDSGGNRTVTKGVWMILKPGEQRAPPAIVVSPAAAWSVVHVRGRPFSLDAVTFTRPQNDQGRQWNPMLDGPTVVPVTPIEPPSDELGPGVIAGIAIVAVAVLICAGAGVFYFLSVRKRRAAAAASSPNGMEMRPASTRSNGLSSMQANASSNSGYGGAPYEMQSGQAHVIPTKQNAGATKAALHDKFKELTTQQPTLAMEGTTLNSLQQSANFGGSPAGLNYDSVPANSDDLMYHSLPSSGPPALSPRTISRSGADSSASLQYNSLPSAPPPRGAPPGAPGRAPPSGRGLPPMPPARGGGGVTYSALSNVQQGM